MFRFILALLFLLFPVSSEAALTLVGTEPFVGPGTLTPASPGSFFSAVSGTFTLVKVGPRTSSVAAPGWSADIRTTGSVNDRGTVNLFGAAATCGMWGAWFRLKDLPGDGGYLSVLQLLDRSSTNVVADFKFDSKGVLTATPFNYAGPAVNFTGPTVALNTWIWLGIAWQAHADPQNSSTTLYDVRCLSKLLNGSLNIWGTANNLNPLDSSFSAVNVGLQTGGTGPNLRVGCPSLFSMSNLSDTAYPASVIAPVEQSYNWYVNTTTGNDASDGSSPSTAWRTATKINLESQYGGMLDSNAAGPGNGDVLNIDTSGGPLVIGSSSLTFATQGLKVQPVSGQTTIKCRAEDILANSAFAVTPGLGKTYQTSDTQALIVAWEDDKWMYHVKAASFTGAAAITDPHTLVTTNYASAGAALDAVPGSFYTDGTKLYLHPFGNTNPETDGKVYTRSINRNQASAVNFTAGNYRAIGFDVRKTTLVDNGDNSFGAYCFEDSVFSGDSQSSSVENGYFAYGDKHCFGSTNGLTNSTLLVLNTDCEQGNPYCGYGGQTPFVSYSGATTADNVHLYRNCTCLARAGLVGSIAGETLGHGGDIILSHNNGIGTSFASITLDHCNFASGSVNLGVATNLSITNQSQIGQLFTACLHTAIDETTFPHELVQMQTGAATLSVQSCLIKPAFALAPSPSYYGFLLSGSVTIQGCTFDLTGFTGDSAAYFQQAILQRTGPLNLTFRNNVYLVPSGENLPLLYNATASDTLNFDHNAYNLGTGTTLVRNFNGPNSLTFAQWQALGNDCVNSSLNANLLLQTDVPQTNSPLFNAGVDLGSAPDVTGTSYTHRNTIGAYQGSATYRAPQSIPNFAVTQSLGFGSSPYTLPATSSAGLNLTYTVSGPATISGNKLTFTGAGTVILTATQAGNSTTAPLSETITLTITATSLAVDTPVMPWWGLALLGATLALVAVRGVPVRQSSF